jgi:hypothetical protein
MPRQKRRGSMITVAAPPSKMMRFRHHKGMTMKVKLTLFSLIYLCTVTTGRAADPVDLMGISAGMPLAELKQLLQAKKWPCEQVSETVFHCSVQAAEGTSTQDVRIQFANALPNMPVVAMKVTFST